MRSPSQRRRRIVTLRILRKLGLSNVRLGIAACVHATLLGIVTSVGLNLVDPLTLVLLAFEMIGFLAVQSSNPGYVERAHCSMNLGDGAGSSLEEGDDDDDADADSETGTAGQPLVPFEWSRKAWRAGPSIDARLPPAPTNLKVWCSK